VVSLTLTVVGFVVVTALVIVLARSSTARWEKTRRAARAPRRDVPAARTTPDADARRSARPVRKALAALGGLGSLRELPKVAAAGLVTVPRLVASRVRPFRRSSGGLRAWLHGRVRRNGRSTTSSSPASPVDDDAAETSAPLIPKRSRGARALRRAAGADAARRRVGRAPRLPRRGAYRFLHRHDRIDEPHVLGADTDESPTAR
jgi:hypothetical protein